MKDKALVDTLIALVKSWEDSVPADSYDYDAGYNDFTFGRFDATLDAADDLTQVLAQHMLN